MKLILNLLALLSIAIATHIRNQLQSKSLGIFSVDAVANVNPDNDCPEDEVIIYQDFDFEGTKMSLKVG